MLILVVLTIGFFYAGGKCQETPTESSEDTEINEEKSEGVVPEIEQKVEKMHEEHEQKEESKAPEEIAADLWKVMKTENYSDRWKMWPGKEALYNGSDPHGALLTTYINSIGYEAVVKSEKEGYHLEQLLQWRITWRIKRLTSLLLCLTWCCLNLNTETGSG